MSYIPGTDQQRDIVESLKQFLTAKSAAPTETLSCETCGSTLSDFPVQFWLEGCDQGWNVRLPYCPQCHPLPATKQPLAA